ncbi:hypothetical protein Q8A67_002966 [Cirrhinus molitorella]|uniref:Chromo domain-containing protein n=1 Tax=Cirrhinus molitorella TaxID=172907 RepID=A0AA88U459_9TELE|nr:hypothetical protein Q8A67_002966 [Cirrhinus molitorella]
MAFQVRIRINKNTIKVLSVASSTEEFNRFTFGKLKEKALHLFPGVNGPEDLRVIFGCLVEEICYFYTMFNKIVLLMISCSQSHFVGHTAALWATTLQPWLDVLSLSSQDSTSHKCSIKLDKLAALNLHPILLLGKNMEQTIVADVIFGGDHVLDDDLLQRLKTVYEAVLKIHFQRAKKKGAASDTFSITSPVTMLDPTTVPVPVLDPPVPVLDPTAPVPVLDPTAPVPVLDPTVPVLDPTAPVPVLDPTVPVLDPTAPVPVLDPTAPVPVLDPTAPDPTTSSTKRKKESTKKNKDKKHKDKCSECMERLENNSFPYQRILKNRMKGGTIEVLVRWAPCTSCGIKWKDSWEPSSFVGL